ncbi:MAG: FAD-dependent oxidoreductase [Phycisphaerales bacterium]|nr:FAD-dependent oxidoreductase [Phycisphaerales bacterium]
MREDVIIVGGGLAGLCCARVLHKAGVPWRVLEASDRVGGRVSSDIVDGFTLDRGFQVFQTAYPEAAKVLDYPALDLKNFEPGASVFYKDAFHTLMDPWRRPSSLLEGALAGVGSLSDKLRVGTWRSEAQRLSHEQLMERAAVHAGDGGRGETIREMLIRRGFSEGMIERFFRPFFGGITLDESLGSAATLAEVVFRCFSIGDSCVPARGMGQIPAQIARSLPSGQITLNTRVASLDELTSARAVVVATEYSVARKLLNLPTGRTPRGVTNMYFAAKSPGEDHPALRRALLLLNGLRTGPAINVAVMSRVSQAYAPSGYELISVSVLGVDHDERALLPMVTEQMVQWFGPWASSWSLLKTYTIREALPDQSPPWYTSPSWPVISAKRPGVFLAGDWRDVASIDGAMRAGRLAGEAVLKHLGLLSAGRAS